MAKQEKQCISIPYYLFFHILSKHKDQILELRLWAIARYILDIQKCGACNMTELARFAKIKPETLLKIIRKSQLFRGFGKHRVYYFSLFKIIQKHQLRKKTKFRVEYPSHKFLNNFQNQLKFKSYIVKCYFENDLRKKIRRITNGRISNHIAAKYFNISERTIQRLIRSSGAIVYKNIQEYRSIKVDIKHSSRLGNWLLNHAGEKIDGHEIGRNFRSYFVRYKTLGKYILCQRLPNIYKFTGVRLVAGIIRGNDLSTSKLSNDAYHQMHPKIKA